MNVCLLCFSDDGAQLALRLCDIWKIDRADVHSTEKFAVQYGFSAHRSVREDMKALFLRYDALIFICACGIAVREIAPFVNSKAKDPAVLVIDDRGQFVIPILSGHIGGANVLAKQTAALLGATAVITTATDIVGRFSCDAWAAEHHCAISSMQLAKEISAAILIRDVPVACDYPLPETLPAGLIEGHSGELGIYIGIKKQKPFQETLRLIPRIVTVGVGCRRGTAQETIFAAINEILEKHEIDIRAVCRIASIDVKQDEPGLLACAKKMNVPAVFFTAEELNTAQGVFEASAFVKETVGVDNVCERAAVCAGSRLLVKKTALNGVTVAAAMEDWSVTF